MRPSPAQSLFDRTAATWIIPEWNVAGASAASPHLLHVLVVWDSPWPAAPTVLFNADVGPRVRVVEVVHDGTVAPGSPVNAGQVVGLRRVSLGTKAPHIFGCIGRNGMYFLAFDKLDGLPFAREFMDVRKALLTEGVALSRGQSQLPVYIDLTRNWYSGTPAHKRAATLQEQQLRVEMARHAAPQAVRRHRLLPALQSHFDPDVTPLLREARDTYIAGYFFSAVAAAATAADRVCLHLADRHAVPADANTQLRGMTFGQKPDKLVSLHLIADSDKRVLVALNRLRNRHIHPKTGFNERALRRDALMAVTLLHEFVERTVSTFRDHVIEQGRLVPRKFQ